MDLFGESAKIVTESEEFTGEVPDIQAAPITTENITLLGHEKIETSLIESYNAQRLPHGMIFAGLEGIGKFQMAQRLVRFLMTRPKFDPNQNAMFDDTEAEPTTLDCDPDHPALRRIVSGGHSDLMVIERYYDSTKNKLAASVTVEQVRKINPFLRMTAGEGGWRIVLINDADTMNRSAQNAILKILEEPPKNTLLILVAHRPGSLLPTIKSRTQTYQFKALSHEHLKMIAADRMSGQELSDLATLAAGSAGRLLSLHEQGAAEMQQEISKIMAYYPKYKYSDIHVMADTVGRAGQDSAFQMFSFLLVQSLRQSIRQKARGEAPADWTKNLNLQDCLKICDNLEEHFNKIERSNLEKRLGVIEAFTLLKSA